MSSSNLILNAPIVVEASDGTRLTGKIYEGKNKAKGLTLFINGYAAKVEDMEPYLLPLAERRHVAAFNLRGHGQKYPKSTSITDILSQGHGRSEGIISAERCTQDVIDIINHFGYNNTTVMAHSFGAVVAKAAQTANINAVVLINPFIHHSYLPSLFDKGSTFLYKNQDKKWFQAIDNHFNEDFTRLGFNMDNVLKNTAGLATLDLRETQIEQPLLYFLADKDESLGTRSAQKLQAYHQAIKNLNPRAEDASPLAEGLNHCLNHRGLVPFLKSENNYTKQKKRIIERTDMFLTRYL